MLQVQSEQFCMAFYVSATFESDFHEFCNVFVMVLQAVQTYALYAPLPVFLTRSICVL